MMAIPNNPFTPTFGKTPANLAGRRQILEEISLAFERGSGAPELSTLISGARGTGKTTLLRHIADRAQLAGWVSVHSTAADGMLDDILVQAINATQHLINQPAKARITGVGLAQMINLQWERDTDGPTNWRLKMQRIIEELDARGSGLLMEIDEVDPRVEEMVQLARDYQHFVTEDRPVALVMAGLPHKVEQAKQNKSISFIRRAQQRTLTRIPDFEVEEAMRKTIVEAGREIEPAALRDAVDAARGFPFMIQLVGYRMWDASPDSPIISTDDALEGISRANQEMRVYIIESTYNELSDMDLRFLQAMLEDTGQSLMSDIAERLGKTQGYVAVYKNRLLQSGIIGEIGRGNAVRFDLPGFQEYLKERVGCGELA